MITSHCVHVVFKVKSYKTPIDVHFKVIHLKFIHCFHSTLFYAIRALKCAHIWVGLVSISMQTIAGNTMPYHTVQPHFSYRFELSRY